MGLTDAAAETELRTTAARADSPAPLAPAVVHNNRRHLFYLRVKDRVVIPCVLVGDIEVSVLPVRPVDFVLNNGEMLK